MSCVLDEPILEKQNHAAKKTQPLDKPATPVETLDAIIDNTHPPLNNNAALLIETIKASVKNCIEINEERVAFFKAELQSGNYIISNEAIVNGMLL